MDERLQHRYHLGSCEKYRRMGLSSRFQSRSSDGAPGVCIMQRWACIWQILIHQEVGTFQVDGQHFWRHEGKAWGSNTVSALCIKLRTSGGEAARGDHRASVCLITLKAMGWGVVTGVITVWHMERLPCPGSQISRSYSLFLPSSGELKWEQSLCLHFCISSFPHSVPFFKLSGFTDSVNSKIKKVSIEWGLGPLPKLTLYYLISEEELMLSLSFKSFKLWMISGHLVICRPVLKNWCWFYLYGQGKQKWPLINLFKGVYSHNSSVDLGL